ncbi:alpha/beta hydrolase [Nocardioides luteus]|uniref:alpha/beta hydrolase n=1 Tax=Nocardioides luteus TaxID=1844 RepID=UPI0018CAD9A6|nr:alpha/beta hydrolase [Nocardioides luteus]MBG6099407.1 acetyl esterase/lipase [Nocardioides luteus]
MSKQQRDALDAAIRDFPFDPSVSVEEARAGFDAGQTRPLPDEARARAVTIGGIPGLELYRDATEGTLLYLHGGGYVVGSARTGASLADGLAGRAGLRAISIDYRLAPEAPYPAAVEDGLAAYRGLLDAGVEPDRLVLAGDSAGGGLTMATLLAARSAGLPQPAAAVLFSPWTDLTLSGATIETKLDADPLFDRAALEWFARRYLGSADPTDPLISPAFADLAGLPPLLIQVGSHEVLLDDSLRLAARAAEADVEVILEVGAELPHVFQNQAGSLDEADAALDRASRFLSERLAGALAV